MEFIHHLWSNNQDSYFWADQVSMDQSNVKERNHQVALMSHIYRNAKLVYAYIGEHEQAYHIRDFSGQPVETLRDCPEAAGPLLEIFAAAYWSRLWILQELCLAVNVIFWVGEATFPKDFLAECWDFIVPPAAGPSGRRHYRPWSRPFLVTEQTRRFLNKPPDAINLALLSIKPAGEGGELDLLTALHMSRSSLCSEPRDKIYGVQALVRKLQRVPVDYKLSQRQVSVAVLERITTFVIQNFERNCEWAENETAKQKCMELQLDLHDDRDRCNEVIEMMFWGAAISCTRFYDMETSTEKNPHPWKVLSLSITYDMAQTDRQRRLAIDLVYLIHIYVRPWRDVDEPLLLEEIHIFHHGVTPAKVWKRRRRAAKEADFQSVLDSVMSKHGFVWFGDIVAHPDEWPLGESRPFRKPSSHKMWDFYKQPFKPSTQKRTENRSIGD